MATIAGANTTTLTETIPTESINGLVLPPANLIRVYQAFTWQCPATGAKHVFPQIVAAAVTGTQTETSANVLKSVGTVTFDGSAAITEHGLFSQAATGGGTLWDRTVFSAVNVIAGESISFEYSATLSAGG